MFLLCHDLVELFRTRPDSIPLRTVLLALGTHLPKGFLNAFHPFVERSELIFSSRCWQHSIFLPERFAVQYKRQSLLQVIPLQVPVIHRLTHPFSIPIARPSAPPFVFDKSHQFMEHRW
uniref:Uncharacterized protein n=1 Tax=Anopheles atroparvus TaxID=41427 RepID=A0A182IJJ0_ANOAO